ncbi:MAG: acetylxylan esterase [Verrucomicrobia bacterium]|nr:acetylxylan esterase [Verrucomicrobiota bacterium]
MSLIRICLLCVVLLATTRAQIADSASGAVANLPVNYTEARTGDYTLPDPLKFADGSSVADAKVWREKRRPEQLKLVEENQYGRVPPRPPALAFDVFDKGTPAFDGKARRKQVTIYFTASHTENYLDLLVYLPAKVTGPAPVLLNFGWGANNLAVPNDPGVKVGRTWNNQQKARVPATPAPDGAQKKGGPGRNIANTILTVLDRGYGFAIFNYNDVDPDALNALAHGIRAAYLKPGSTAPASDEWGSIAAWAWAASRVLDYFETDPAIDAKRIALTGASRLGKTTLWAGARDERFACVIASVSGEGGAALSRRDYGETIAHLVAPTRYPYQFAGNYQKWADKTKAMPWDAHTIIALIAPRPLLLQTGSTDKWSDPYGEFLAAKAASPVYALFGKKGIEPNAVHATAQPLLNTLGHFMHDGPHGVLPSDWPVYLDFMDAHMKAAK